MFDVQVFEQLVKLQVHRVDLILALLLGCLDGLDASERFVRMDLLVNGDALRAKGLEAPEFQAVERQMLIRVHGTEVNAVIRDGLGGGNAHDGRQINSLIKFIFDLFDFACKMNYFTFF